MSGEEIVGVVIDRGYVTNDPGRVEAASLSRQRVQYVSRDRARLTALRTKRQQWNVLAKAPALFVILDGVRYRRCRSDSPISFPLPAYGGQ